jgi:TonB family protein
LEDTLKAAILVTTVGLLAIATPAPAQDDRQVYKPGNGVTAPWLLREVKPRYPADAMSAGINGLVKLECIVQADGTVGEVRVLESLYPSLDDEAVRVMKEWKFGPGTKDGKAVAVLVEVEMSFTTVRGPRLDSADVFKQGPGITLPKKLQGGNPSYTENARAAAIQGTVVLDCVVLDTGTVGDVRVSKSLDRELDAEAIRTLRQWRFTPGEREGRPVPVQVSVEMTFSLR